MPQSKYAQVPQLWSLCSRAWKPQITEACRLDPCAPQQENPHNEKHPAQLESSPHPPTAPPLTATGENLEQDNEDPDQPKIK